MINYSYIIVDRGSRRAALIDPAWELDKIRDKLEELKVELVAIFLTHSHPDHVNLVDELVDIYNPAVYIQEDEVSYYGYNCQNLIPLKHLAEVELGRTTVRCLHTPGHTKGGACYLLSSDIFTGDTLFIEGCGICTTRGGDPDEMFDSLQMLKGMIKPSVHVYPGHSYGAAPGLKMELLLKGNLYLAIDRREHFVSYRMRKRQFNLFNFR